MASGDPADHLNVAQTAGTFLDVVRGWWMYRGIYDVVRSVLRVCARKTGAAPDAFLTGGFTHLFEEFRVDPAMTRLDQFAGTMSRSPSVTQSGTVRTL
ncbi:MAG: hypothetical protein MZV65_16835 [Chromatiales bacterium]|nr:hypothetical protein [Chromatiales bacterium]